MCEQKGVEIIEAEACVDHIHMLVSIPPHISVSQFMEYLKGKSTLMIFDCQSVRSFNISVNSEEFLNSSVRGYFSVRSPVTRLFAL